ncbi:MAG: hypothetical protein ACREQ9_11905 [Candidatus Binatia bacterium]
MLLAFLALALMLLGTCFLSVFGRHVAGLLEKWGRDASRNPSAAAGRGS